MTSTQPPAYDSKKAGRTGLAIGGGILATIGAVVAVTGAGVLAIGGADGKLQTGHHDVSTPTSALVSEAAKVNGAREVTDVIGNSHFRIDATSSKPVFVGIGRKADVDRYLAGAETDRVTDFDTDPFTLDTTRMHGETHPKPPATQSFWVAKSTGTTANLDWKVRDGRYRIVVMNADGSRGVTTQSEFEVQIPHLGTIAIVALIIGLTMMAGGVAMIVPSFRSGSGSGASAAPPAPTRYAIG
jgi:hypothetical protein